MINTSMDVCRFCSMPVNHVAAEEAAAFMDKINRACSESSYTQIAATGIPIFRFFNDAGRRCRDADQLVVEV
jgi:hypothetical protein